MFRILSQQNTLFNKIRYFFEIFRQIIHVKTSKVVVIDGNNVVITNLKRRETKIIQIWHASAAIKKFGQDYKRKFPITKCDYMITTSSTFIDIMASAFNIDRENVLPLGYVDSGVLFNKKKLKKYKEEMYLKYPFLKSKKVILYAPTFTANRINQRTEIFFIQLLFIEHFFGTDYQIIDTQWKCRCRPYTRGACRAVEETD